MFMLKLPKELEDRLEVLAKATGHTKDYYDTALFEAVLEAIEDMEDIYEAEQVLKNPGKIYSMEEAEREFDKMDSRVESKRP